MLFDKKIFKVLHYWMFVKAFKSAIQKDVEVHLYLTEQSLQRVHSAAQISEFCKLVAALVTIEVLFC